MALKLFHKLTHNGVKLMNCHCYKFKYLNFENDPYPHIFFLYGIRGTHQTSGNKWNLIQAINLNYLPRARRRAFVKEWADTLTRSRGNFHYTWKMVSHKFPYMRLAVRRYLLSPSSLIRNLEYIPPENMEQEIVRNYHRDFSMVAARERAKRVLSTIKRRVKGRR